MPLKSPAISGAGVGINASMEAPLICRKPSYEKKKNVRFFRTGPADGASELVLPQFLGFLGLEKAA